MEDTSKLRAHSTSLINIAIIKGKQLQARTFQCFKEAGLAALTKPRGVLAPVMYRAENRATNFKSGTLQLQELIPNVTRMLKAKGAELCQNASGVVNEQKTFCSHQ